MNDLNVLQLPCEIAVFVFEGNIDDHLFAHDFCKLVFDISHIVLVAENELCHLADSDEINRIAGDPVDDE